MILAISDNVWLGIIGIAALLIKEYFDRARAAKAAVTVDAVVAKTESIATNIQKVEKATDGMKDQLVALTDKEAYGRGKIEERERADVVVDAKAKEPKDATVVEIKVDVAESLKKDLEAANKGIKEVPKEVVKELDEREK